MEKNTMQEKSRWDDWSADELTKEILNRINYFYSQTDGTFRFPNNAEGDLLQITYKLLTKK